MYNLEYSNISYVDNIVFFVMYSVGVLITFYQVKSGCLFHRFISSNTPLYYLLWSGCLFHRFISSNTSLYYLLWSGCLFHRFISSSTPLYYLLWSGYLFHRFISSNTPLYYLLWASIWPLSTIFLLGFENVLPVYSSSDDDLWLFRWFIHNLYFNYIVEWIHTLSYSDYPFGIFKLFL
jgi:hypothetical protein